MSAALAVRVQAVATDAKRLDRNTFKGAFDLQLASGILLRGCTLHCSHGKWWCGLPSRPYTTAAGGQSWSPIVDFRDRSARDRFQRLALDAARLAFPEVDKEAQR